MNEKLSGRDKVRVNLHDYLREQYEIQSKYIPKSKMIRLLVLEQRIEDARDALKLTDAQLEWGNAGGFDRCPRSYTTAEIEADVDKVLTKLCTEKDCPEYEGCWATKQLKAPCELITSGTGPVDAKPHPTFKRS
jgi:hypothetical protein